HRGRPDTFGPGVDRFSALTIATGLRCARVGGADVWKVLDSGDNLLFRQADLANPDASPAFRKLPGVADLLAKHLVRSLWDARRRPRRDVPSLKSVIDSAPVLVDIGDVEFEDYRPFAPAPAPPPPAPPTPTTGHGPSQAPGYAPQLIPAAGG